MKDYFGINFPFTPTRKGDYLRMTETPQEEVRSNLIHLLLTRKGTRYFLPEFGTRLYEFIFEQMDNQTFASIEEDIREACRKFIPNLEIQTINIKAADEFNFEDERNLDPDLDPRIYRVAAESALRYTAQIRIDYSVKNAVFSSRDFIIINL